MAAWIMSVVGVICLGVLFEIVLPTGKTTKYIRGAFSLLVVFVVASIVPSIAKADWKFELDNVFSSTDVLATSDLDLTLSLKEKARLALQREGCECRVEIDSSGTVVKKVKIYVEKTTIDGACIVEITSKTLNVFRQIIYVIYSE